jgi:mono/diheme cytochrome c family protein
MKQVLVPSLVLAIGLTTFASAQAQEIDPANVRRGKTVWNDKATCGFCHGWAGDGNGEPRSPGRAPSLRTTPLDRDGIYEVVQCGRPNSAMPYHDQFAYTDKRCYDSTKEDLGTNMPQPALQGLNRNEIGWVVDYVMAMVKGRGEITREECETYFSKGSINCVDLK